MVCGASDSRVHLTLPFVYFLLAHFSRKIDCKLCDNLISLA